MGTAAVEQAGDLDDCDRRVVCPGAFQEVVQSLVFALAEGNEYERSSHARMNPSMASVALAESGASDSMQAKLLAQ